MFTFYTNSDCKFYIREKLNFLIKRGKELTTVFKDEALAKEINVNRSILDILSTIEEIKSLPKGDLRNNAIELLINQ